jgi:hypothetical protein
VVLTEIGEEPHTEHLRCKSIDADRSVYVDAFRIVTFYPYWTIESVPDAAFCAGGTISTGPFYVTITDLRD